MKFEINIEKKHLYFLSTLVLIVGAGVVIAAASWSANKPYHEPLYTNTIQPKSGDKVTVEGNLEISPGKALKTGALQTDTIESKTGNAITIKNDLNIEGSFHNFQAFGPEICTPSIGSACTKDLISQNEGVCFLTRVYISDLDDDSEHAECKVYIFGGKWKLYAREVTSDLDVSCSAMCLKW